MTEVYFANTSPLDDPARLERLLSLLSPHRREKALLCRSDAARRLSAGAAYLLSAALARIGVDERSVTYQTGDNGKPFVAGLPGIDFSLSHSGKMVMCALGDAGAVGCDIESLRERGTAVARRFFTESEYRHIICAAEPEREFIRCWTLKESYVKMLGTGLSIPLSSFEINPGPPPAVVGMPALFFYEYEPAESYAAALCTAAPPTAPPVTLNLGEI